MKSRKLIITLLTVAFAFMLVFSGQAMAGETYKMGLSLAITGPTSDVGSPYAKGA